ncbi:DUF4407 domain-containing protein [Nonomuraea indica]|uniref:DUF4407 domain-containing protein n=1 Tax=Nonomuraea indica TaxID=1581193 RepID=UPI000C7A6A42|nr:DUF4407 domain-containing protein [Nonomuraea indica]
MTETRRRPGSRLAGGRWLRRVAGADERLLDRVPHERMRYTGLGGVVISTSVIAGLSMWFFLSQMLGEAHILLLIPVAIWSLTVLNLDRWLISTVSVMWQRRLLMLLPRLAVATVLGLVIAEPLVLRFFETAVVQQVKDEREAARSTLKDTLIRCNPTPPQRPPAGECGAGTTLLRVTPAEQVGELAKLERRRDRQTKELQRLSTEHTRLARLATAECNGTPMPNVTSGLEGYGPRCREAYKTAADFRRDRGIADKRTELDQLRADIAARQRSVTAMTSGYSHQVAAAIDERVAALPAGSASIGLLERKKALDRLTGEDAFLWGFTWLLRLLLLLIDCLPVLVKIMGGTSVYDRLVDAENRKAERVHREWVETEEEGEVGELELRRAERAEARHRRAEQLELSRRRHQAEMRSQVRRMVSDRTSELLRDEGQNTGVNGSRLVPFQHAP